MHTGIFYKKEHKKQRNFSLSLCQKELPKSPSEKDLYWICILRFGEFSAKGGPSLHFAISQYCFDRKDTLFSSSRPKYHSDGTKWRDLSLRFGLGEISPLEDSVEKTKGKLGEISRFASLTRKDERERRKEGWTPVFTGERRKRWGKEKRLGERKKIRGEKSSSISPLFQRFPRGFG